MWAIKGEKYNPHLIEHIKFFMYKESSSNFLCITKDNQFTRKINEDK